MLICYKTFITEEGKIKKYSTGQVILEDINITYQEILEYINKADRVENLSTVLNYISMIKRITQ